MDDLDRRLLNRIQSDFPLVARPFQELGQPLGLSEDEVVERMRALGARVVLHGEDFDAAKAEARRVARESGARFVEDGLDIETLEGAGTIGLEWLMFPDPVDALLIPLGNGALFTGVAWVMKDGKVVVRK